MRWFWRRAPKVKDQHKDAISDAAQAREARRRAEQAEQRTAQMWPRVHRAVNGLRDVAHENHFSEAIKSIFRST
jgi:hypothetical protein